ncbi:MAG: hypothetical protein KAR24_00720 [Candidatus Pacebacteria bacterium]|nr:hypothetical protein [Candidatus Paceibacterota bacterium]
MNSVLQSDVFFFISSVSVVFITVVFLIAIMYVIKILRDIHGFLATIRKGTETLSEDLSEVRMKLNDKGVWTGFILSIVTAVAGFNQKRQNKKKKK